MSSNPLNHAVVVQVLNDLRHGQLRRCLLMGFTPDDLALLRKPELVSLLINTQVKWCDVQVNAVVLRRLFGQVLDVEKEIAVIDRMLSYHASSKMVHEVFGLNQREVAFRRKLLGLKQKRGRWTVLTEKQEHELWRIWKERIDAQKANTRDKREMAKICLDLADETRFAMATIWQSIEKWIEEGLT